MESENEGMNSVVQKLSNTESKLRLFLLVGLG